MWYLSRSLTAVISTWFRLSPLFSRIIFKSYSPGKYTWAYGVTIFLFMYFILCSAMSILDKAISNFYLVNVNWRRISVNWVGWYAPVDWFFTWFLVVFVAIYSTLTLITIQVCPPLHRMGPPISDRGEYKLKCQAFWALLALFFSNLWWKYQFLSCYFSILFTSWSPWPRNPKFKLQIDLYLLIALGLQADVSDLQI